MSHGQIFEMLEIDWQMAKESAIFTDTAIAGNGCYHMNHYTATSMDNLSRYR